MMHFTYLSYTYNLVPFLLNLLTQLFIYDIFLLGFDWSLHFKWDSLTTKEKQARKKNPVAPIRYITAHVIQAIMYMAFVCCMQSAWPLVLQFCCVTCDDKRICIWDTFLYRASRNAPFEISRESGVVVRDILKAFSSGDFI